MACSMGCYQAYFGVTCIILLIYFIKELFWDADKNIVRDVIFKVAGTVMIGGFFYKCMVTLVNAIYHVHLSNYKDVSNISLRSIIVNLPHRIPKAYKEFFQFYFTDVHQRMTFGLRWVFMAAFLVTLCLFLYKLKDISRRNKRNAILSILAILLVPLASNATLILITTPNVILMTAGTAVLFSLFLCLFDGFFKRKLLYSCYLCILIVLFWVNICIVSNDQIAIRDIRTATVTIAQNIVTRLLDEGYIDSGNKFVFWGSPSANRLFFETPPFKKANGYAKFGAFGTGVWSNRAHWNGLFSAYCGIKFNFWSDEQYKELMTKEEIKEMPCFPDRKSIQKIDGVVVVKVSNTL